MPAAGCAGGGATAGGTGPVAAPLQAIQFTDDAHGWAAGAGRIVATTDGGRTWRRQYAGPAVLSQVDFTGNPGAGNPGAGNPGAGNPGAAITGGTGGQLLRPPGLTRRVPGRPPRPT